MSEKNNVGIENKENKDINLDDEDVVSPQKIMSVASVGNSFSKQKSDLHEEEEEAKEVEKVIKREMVAQRI